MTNSIISATTLAKITFQKAQQNFDEFRGPSGDFRYELWMRRGKPLLYTRKKNWRNGLYRITYPELGVSISRRSGQTWKWDGRKPDDTTLGLLRLVY